MPRPASRDTKSPLMRLRIAAHAARLMAQDGIDDFSLAKRKAARQLSAAATQSLPSNEEIEVELKAYRELYHAEEHASLQREFRLKALGLMRFFQRFDPYLTGAVLSGSAGRHSSVNVQLFAANEKEFELFLLNNRISFSLEEEADFRCGHEQRVCVFCLDWKDTPFRLAIYDPLALRGALKADPTTGLPERASIAFVERILDPDGAAPEK